MHALFGREAVLVHEGVDAGMLALVGARGMHEVAGDVGRAAALVLGEHGALDQPADEAVFVDQMMGGDLVAGREAPREGGQFAPQGRDHAVSGTGKARTHTIRIWAQS